MLWLRAGVLVLLTAGIIFEFIHIPPFHFTHLNRIPEVYQWLKNEPGEFIVAEYPLHSSIEGSHYDYLIWQRVHQKRLFNGARIGTREERLRGSLIDLKAPGTVQILGRLGVKYILHHGSPPFQNGTEDMKLIHQFGRTAVYKVETYQPGRPPPPLDTIVRLETDKREYSPGEVVVILANVREKDGCHVSGENVYGFMDSLSHKGEYRVQHLEFQDLGNGKYQALHEIQPRNFEFPIWNIKVQHYGFQAQMKNFKISSLKDVGGNSH